MQRSHLIIKRRRTGASPETFQLMLKLLVATAFLFFIKICNYANSKSQFRIYGGGNPNSSGNHETRGESKLLQGIIPAKFGF